MYVSDEAEAQGKGDKSEILCFSWGSKHIPKNADLEKLT